VRAARLAAWTAACGLLAASPAPAQSPAPRVEVSVAGVWGGGAGLGTQPADETLNQAGGGAFTLFTTTSRVTAIRGVEARVGVRLGRHLALEAGGWRAKASVATRVSGDAEQAPDVTATAGFTEYVADGAVVLRLPGLAFAGGRAEPFAEAGAGYLRQVYAGQAVVETGSILHAGGGLRVWLRTRPAGWLDGVGVRLDGRLVARRGGIDLGTGGARLSAAVTAGLVVGF